MPPPRIQNDGNRPEINRVGNSPANQPGKPTQPSPTTGQTDSSAASKRGEVQQYGAYRRSQITDAAESGFSIFGNAAKGVEADRVLPQQFRLQSLTPDLSRGNTTVAMIKDVTRGRLRGTPPMPVGEPVIRFDGAHGGSPFPHLNINPNVTGVKDPHLRVPSGLIETASGAAKTLEAVGRVARPVAIATDTIRLGMAFHEDGDTVGRHTVITGGSVAGGWAGAAGGAWAGAQGGAAAGAFVGAFFGGVGAAPGAAIGGVVGSIAGGIAGAFGGSWLGEKAAETAVGQ